MTAAEQLEGVALPGGWKITRQLPRGLDGTGGMFSQSYEVVRDGRKGFLKAFDFSEAFEDGQDTLAILNRLTAGYEHERTVLTHCADRSLSHVVIAIDHGHVQVPGLPIMEGRVYYLIFEMADGDVRCQMDLSTRFDAVWSMQALRDVCLGLWQVHKEMIAHQDTKPSNVLAYRDKTFKIADFGRSSRKGHPVWHDDREIAGDRTYAPPELLYGHTNADFVARRVGCDLYMLGNLAAFLFSGRNVTAMLFERLGSEHHPSQWTGTYQQVLPYLNFAFTRLLEDLKPVIDETVCADVLRLIGELCAPDLARRGHPRGIGRHNQYSLERYVSTLDAASGRARLQVRLQAMA
ncbi:protein kinase domain-containing protein [Caulobacter sp.]|uniref:protein kinase domain-containing protein n=1 Tax=Caulobacter sp. TaxID=78 RepID=UPI003BAA635B